MSILKHRLFRNASALFGVQVASWILPLILLPYYARQFGVDLFGVVAFALSAIQLGFLVTDYGFSLSATEEISRHRDDKAHVERLIGAIFLIKIGLTVVASLAVAAIPWAQADTYGPYWRLFALCALPIAGQAYQPLWFFQGVERMSLMSVYTVTAKSTYLVLALLLVRGAEDYWLVPVALGAAQLLAAGLGIGLMVREGHRPRLPSAALTWSTFKLSTQFFASRASVAAYAGTSVVLLATFGSPAQAGLFSVAEQLYRAIQMVFAPVNQALYPYMVREKNFQVFAKVLLGVVATCLVGIGVGFVVSPYLVTLIFGPEFEASVPILYLFFGVVLVNTPSVLLGYPLLGSFGQSRFANYSVFIGGGAYAVAVTLVANTRGLDAAVMVHLILLAEALVLWFRAGHGFRLARNQRLASNTAT